jgi:rhodanese-related sulfurtransferase
MSLEQPAFAAAPNPAPADAAAQPLIPSLTWAQVKPLLEAGKILLVDARAKANFDIGHIPGAVSLPATSQAPELQAFVARFSKDTPFVVYCGSEQCHASRQLAESLVKIGGFTDVREMPGGYAEFLTTQPPRPQANK